MNTMKAFGLPAQYCLIPTDSDRDTPNKLFLGGVPFQATEKELEEFFSQFGKVKDVRIVTDRITAECKGYGFVTFDENENIDELLEKKAVRMKGKKIRIRRAIRRNGSQFDYLNNNKVSPSTNGMQLLKTVSPPMQNYGSTILSPPPSPEIPLTLMQSPLANSPYMSEQLSPVENVPQMVIPPPQIPVQEMMIAGNQSPFQSYSPPSFHSPNQVVILPRPLCSHVSDTYNVHFPNTLYPR